MVLDTKKRVMNESEASLLPLWSKRLLKLRGVSLGAENSAETRMKSVISQGSIWGEGIPRRKTLQREGVGMLNNSGKSV